MYILRASIAALFVYSLNVATPAMADSNFEGYVTKLNLTCVSDRGRQVHYSVTKDRQKWMSDKDADLGSKQFRIKIRKWDVSASPQKKNWHMEMTDWNGKHLLSDFASDQQVDIRDQQFTFISKGINLRANQWGGANTWDGMLIVVSGLRDSFFLDRTVDAVPFVCKSED